jgi:hypothetical protein
MFSTVVFVPLLSVFLAPAFADEGEQRKEPAAHLLSSGVARAKEQAKKVFLLFGSPG